MISAQDIAAWRPFAPWSTDLMVEQDFLLSRAVELIFEDTFLGKQVAMRGGTVLHKSHLQPASRYSEDIDLVLVGERPGNHIEKALKRLLRPLLGKPAESFATDVRLAIRNLVMKSKIIRQQYVYLHQLQELLKREYASTEHSPALRKRILDVLDVMLSHEMYGTDGVLKAHERD
jgi:Nucleotidyl transferase AbiEii toxin, Type IV TA system